MSSASYTSSVLLAEGSRNGLVEIHRMPENFLLFHLEAAMTNIRRELLFFFFQKKQVLHELARASQDHCMALASPILRHALCYNATKTHISKSITLPQNLGSLLLWFTSCFCTSPKRGVTACVVASTRGSSSSKTFLLTPFIPLRTFRAHRSEPRNRMRDTFIVT